MKELAKIFAYLVGTVLLGALLSPPLYWAGTSLHFFQQYEFQRFFNRAVLVAAVILLVPALRWLKVPTWKAVGLEPDPYRWTHLLVGFLGSFLVMAGLGFGLVEVEMYRWKASLPFGALPKIALTAITVAVIEEALFRGAFLGLMKKALPIPGAVLFNSALFSVIHFLKPRDHAIAPGDVRWWSGFELLGEAFWQFGEPLLVLAGFTTLLCIGIVLAWVTLRTRSLWMAIGLHAGWVFGKMGFSKLTKRIGDEQLPWIGKDVTIGLVPLACVALTGVLVASWLAYEQRRARR